MKKFILLACFLALATATPTQAATLSASSITGDTTWTKADSPYVVHEGFTVSAGATLTIEPGVWVKFDTATDFTATISGVIIAEGTDLNPIIFTSLNDDTVGGDTNGDGSLSTPTRQDWSLLFSDAATSTFTHTSFRYTRGMTAVRTPLIITSATLAHSGSGWSSTSGTLTIDHLVARDNVSNTVIALSGHAQGRISDTTITTLGGWYNWGNAVDLSGASTIVLEHTVLRTGVFATPLALYDAATAVVHSSTITADLYAPALHMQGDARIFLADTALHSANSTVGLFDRSALFATSTIIDTESTYQLTFAANGSTTTFCSDCTISSFSSSNGGMHTFTSSTLGRVFVSHATLSLASTTMHGGTLVAQDATVTIDRGLFDQVNYYDGDINAAISLTNAHATITNAIIRNNERGIAIDGGQTTITNSMFSGNTIDALFARTSVSVLATNNWWGDPSGPTHPSNPSGTGDRVTGGINFTPWLRQEPSMITAPTTCVIECNSNVLFLPGLEASRLYDISGNEIWLPDSDTEADSLSMDSNGVSIHQDVTTQDVIDEAHLGQAYTNIYKSFLTEMKGWESTYHITATTTPYDWRLDYDTVVSTGRKLSNGHISYLVSPTSGHDPYIIETLKQLAATSKTGKVTIIAHSQGGLIAKALMQKLGDATTAKLIDKVIFVAAPQLGTPQAIATLLNGTNAQIKFAISPQKVRQLAQNMQSAYNLLPSANYFTYVDDPVITIASSSLPVWAQHYGDSIHWDGGMRAFMYDADVIRAKPTYADLDTPEIVDPLKLLRAQTVHSALDSWIPPAGVQLTTIAGWGLETLSSLAYHRECATRNILGVCVVYSDNTTVDSQHVVDGDGTVVEPSAQWSSRANTTRLWLNLSGYNNDHPIDATPLGRDHKNILEVPQLRALLTNLIIGTSTPLQYISTTAPQYLGNESRLHFTLHSPLTLEFYDTLGNHVGYSSTTGQIDLNIPRVNYERYGDVQWLSVPKDIAGQLVMHGTRSGSFTLDAEEVNGNAVLSTTSFEAIPSATNTVVTMNVLPTQLVTASSTLVIDVDSNGTTDMTLHAKKDGIVNPPPPYRFSGFFQPINDITTNPSQSLSVFKGGSTIPVKFHLLGASGTPIQASTSPIWLMSQKGASMSAPIGETSYSDSATSGTTFRYDPATQQYIYNWSTKGVFTGYWYRISMKLGDGSIQSVVVGLR